MLKKDQEKVNFLEPTYESKTRLVKNGHTYKVILTWRGKTYMVQMFVPSVSRPTRQQVEKEVQKIYPDAKLMSFLPKDLEPGEPTVMMGEEKRDEYGDIVGGPKISKKKKAKNLAKNEKDEQHTTTTSEMVDLPKFSQDSVNKAKGADSSFVKPNGNKPKVTMRDQINRIKNDPKGKKAKEDAMRDMNINDEYLNELSLDTLSQATRQAYSKREAARGTSEFIKRQRQAEKFSNAASKKRRELDATKDKLGKTFKGPDADRTPTMEEYISELSPATLGGYIKKAKIDIRDTATDRVMAITGIKGAKSKLDKTAAAVKNLQKAREKNAFATSTLPLSAPP